MSVLIKMEMPKNCSDCNFCYDMFMCCMADGPEMDYEKMDMERHPDCPLIEVKLVDQEEVIMPLNMIGGYLKKVEGSEI